MIHIKSNNDVIEIKGHAEYAEYGKDIVCAAVSSIVITTINAINMVSIDSIIIDNSSTDELKVKIIKHSKITNKLIQNMFNMLDELILQYPKNIERNDF